jgi:hypothetical protein
MAERELKRPLTEAEEAATAPILTRSFSEPELGELLQFYRSPVGQQSREAEFGQSLMGELARERRRSSP